MSTLDVFDTFTSTNKVFTDMQQKTEISGEDFCTNPLFSYIENILYLVWKKKTIRYISNKYNENKQQNCHSDKIGKSTLGSNLNQGSY